jgi:hypothetical protein
MQVCGPVDLQGARMSVDWSKAPEGATHFDPVDQNWLMQFLNVSFNWLASEGWATKGWQYPNDLSTMPRLVARPAWSGEGLPPVGTVCGLMFRGCDQGTVTVLFIGDQVGVFRSLSYNHEQVGDLASYSFYIVGTPEEVESQERKDSILEMTSIAGGQYAPRDSIVQRLYDAGFRKQVKP